MTKAWPSREKIFPEAVGMILERPLIGWGPLNHVWELGPRVGHPFRDEHNVYLSILGRGRVRWELSRFLSYSGFVGGPRGARVMVFKEFSRS